MSLHQTEETSRWGLSLNFNSKLSRKSKSWNFSSATRTKTLKCLSSQMRWSTPSSGTSSWLICNGLVFPSCLWFCALLSGLNRLSWLSIAFWWSCSPLKLLFCSTKKWFWLKSFKYCLYSLWRASPSTTFLSFTTLGNRACWSLSMRAYTAKEWPTPGKGLSKLCWRQTRRWQLLFWRTWAVSLFQSRLLQFTQQLSSRSISTCLFWCSLQCLCFTISIWHSASFASISKRARSIRSLEMKMLKLS